MNRSLFLLILLGFFLSCKNANPSGAFNDQPSIANENFDWLIGNWERTNEEEGKETFENWVKVNQMEYHGFGFTMEHEDTIWQENMKLISRDTNWDFEVTQKGENQPTIFRLKNIEINRFDSENQDNPFPKIISYFRIRNKLHAIISGGGTEIPFDFVPVSQ